MSTARPDHDAPAARTDLPTSLESSDSKLVYLYLSAAGEATVDELRSALGMKQLALFPVLRSLERKGLIAREAETFAPVA